MLVRCSSLYKIMDDPKGKEKLTDTALNGF